MLVFAAGFGHAFCTDIVWYEKIDTNLLYLFMFVTANYNVYNGKIRNLSNLRALYVNQ
jgi:hypothetical protein